MRVTNLDSVNADLIASLDEYPNARTGAWVNHRIVSVLASPELGSASGLAVGVSAIPAGGSTPTHSHEAEELAVVIAGDGWIDIGAERLGVRPGDVVLTPPNELHATTAADHGPLTVLWIYAPAGSERRWLSSDPQE